MEFVVNARTNVQLAWFRKTYHPTKPLEQLAEEGLLDEFLLHTRSVDYARSIINMAGYRIKRVKLELYGPNSRLGGLDRFYKVAKDGESWKQFLKRYGLAANDNGPPGFNIVIEVEPHPGALRKMAAKQAPPRRCALR